LGNRTWEILKPNRLNKFQEQTHQLENDLELIWKDFENDADYEKWSSKLKELIRKFQEDFGKYVKTV